MPQSDKPRKLRRGTGSRRFNELPSSAGGGVAEGRGGVVRKFLDHTTPSARTNEASRLFLIVQPPLLRLRRGADCRNFQNAPAIWTAQLGQQGRVWTALLLVLVTVSGCLGPHYIRTDASSRVAAPRLTGLTEHVVLVSIDGLRPDAISPKETPTLSRLTTEGSYTLSARTILPSKTLPSHTSMLTGQPPDIHGVSWNTNARLTKRNGRHPHRLQHPSR